MSSERDDLQGRIDRLDAAEKRRRRVEKYGCTVASILSDADVADTNPSEQ